MVNPSDTIILIQPILIDSPVFSLAVKNPSRRSRSSKTRREQMKGKFSGGTNSNSDSSAVEKGEKSGNNPDKPYNPEFVFILLFLYYDWCVLYS